MHTQKTKWPVCTASKNFHKLLQHLTAATYPLEPYVDGGGAEGRPSSAKLRFEDMVAKAQQSALFDPIPDPLALAAVGWAGYVGEVFECDPHLNSGWVFDHYRPSAGDLSTTDLKKIKGVGRKHRAQAMDIAISVIRANWQEILVIASALELDYRRFGCAAAQWNGQWRMTDGRALPAAVRRQLDLPVAT